MFEDPNRQKSEYELFRERNIREREAYFAALSDDEEGADALAEIKGLCQSFAPKTPSKTVKRKRRNTADGSCSFPVKIPVERRKSARLARLPPQHYDDGLLDEVERRRRHPSENIRDSERSAFNRRRRQHSSRTTLAAITPAEEITEQILNNIATNSTAKVYSIVGTTCHQCRQKTLDTKTICRSGRCVGIYGQFCGPCLKNRYGEQVAVALKDPRWECPYCRGQCNCSICRTHVGKRPTGILAPLALQNGFISVHHMLENLNGYGDIPETENHTTDSDGHIPIADSETTDGRGTTTSIADNQDDAHGSIPNTPNQRYGRESAEIVEQLLLAFDNSGEAIMSDGILAPLAFLGFDENGEPVMESNLMAPILL